MASDPCCAHLRVIRFTEAVEDGAFVDRWACTFCGATFAPVGGRVGPPEDEVVERLERGMREATLDSIRLRDILATERGVRAPAGWHGEDDEWTKGNFEDGPSLTVRRHRYSGRWDFVVRGHPKRAGDPLPLIDVGHAPTALEAMEAADAAVSAHDLGGE